MASYLPYIRVVTKLTLIHIRIMPIKQTIMWAEEQKTHIWTSATGAILFFLEVYYYFYYYC